MYRFQISFTITILVAICWRGIAPAQQPPASSSKPKIKAPLGMENRPGPWNDPSDPTLWPNQTSRANSDAWLVQNHDKIRQMRPRLLLIDFSNEHSTDHLRQLTKRLIAVLAESSRYHGYRNVDAPAFLEYEIFKFVDLRDADRKTGNSRSLPVKDPQARKGFNMKYSAYFSEEFAKHYGVPSPQNPDRFLKLNELLDLGYVHEVWFFESGNVNATPHSGSYEVVEQKPRYDEKFKRLGKQWVQAGNGGDPDQPWHGRSCRIGCINASRGIGCFLESLAHGIEGNANSNAIPYFTKYFKEYADFQLDSRFGLPFNSLYAVDYRGTSIEYPTQDSLVVTHRGEKHTVRNYVAAAGSAHFPPNARNHYDLANTDSVLSTIEDWRIGSGPGGKDLAQPFSNRAFESYKEIAPDCMGAWLVYWRQNMPSYQNRQKDDKGKPMKNWIPFLFY